MACEKYSSRVTDAVLGALPSSEHAELIAHLGGCDACRTAYQRGGEVAALLDRGVSSLVEGAPSSAFAARLRARIAEEHVPLRWTRGTRVAATAGAFALAGALLVAAIHAVRGGNPAPAIAWKALAPAPPVAESVRAPALGILVRPRPRRVVNARASHGDEPAVLIDPSQLAAVKEFARALAAGRMDGKELVSGQRKIETPLQIRELKIPPLQTAAEESHPLAEDYGGL